MEIRDYNGKDKWSKDEIIRRYKKYCVELNIKNEFNLSPNEQTEGNVKWIYPVMNKVIEGIEKGDSACKKIGIEFIEENSKFPFGKVLKSNTARALRRSTLTLDEQERIRKRLVNMLIDGNVPHEYKQYAKLMKKIGVGNYWNEIEERIDKSNNYVMKYFEYLKEEFQND